MKRLIAIALVLAACGTTPGLSLRPPGTLEAAVSALPSPIRSSGSTLTPSSSVSTRAYPSGWLAGACTSLQALLDALAVRPDLQEALTLDDYPAIASLATRMYESVLEAQDANTDLPRWVKAEKLKTRLVATASAFEDAAIALYAGGNEFDLDRVADGIISLSSATDLMAGTMRMFSSLGDRYSFSCRNV